MSIEQSTPRQTVPALIAQRLRAAIVRGDLRAGQPLRQSEIAERFGVSRIPVREALSQLEGEGWVTSVPHRGVLVTEMSAEDIRELCELRVDLETRALRLAIPNLDRAALARAKVVLDAIDADPTLDSWAERNLEFHRTLYEAAKRPRLLAFITNLHQLTARYLLMHVSALDYREQGQREHREILTAARKGDAKRAEAILRRHIADVAELLETYLRSRRSVEHW